ncbi:toxin-antitoxin system YwqK family antitoxin [Aureispira anguillae]|uniref:Antitoxin component YwqK of the YwqJK toxin-antitoxin module n=1 Tax=Aureispira anguillae TaxID=2864201 RepID=A0A915YIE1_9BACT|nr:hypothetical protein [Aureispira anguillae]BDS13739.1 hypothetical protein AsAng_0044800 [Aureispira anguillae]
MHLLKIFISFVLFFCLYACKTKTVIVRYDKRVVERYQVLAKTNTRHGYYKVYHDNGNLALEHTYEKGKLQGEEKIYHEDGSLSGVLNLEKGKYQGPFIYYHPEGTIKQKGYYKDDVLMGKLYSYYNTGQLKECVTIKRNMEDGPFQEYSPEGVLIREGNYVSILGDEEGLEHGLLYEYDAETRKLMTKKRCDEGFCCIIWQRGKGYLRPMTSVCDEIMKESKEKEERLGSD